MGWTVRAILLVSAVASACAGNAATYYVDSSHGSDVNTGLSEKTAWKSLARVNAAAKDLRGGDRVLFRRGGLWRGTLRPASGEKGRPILYSSYGTGSKPIFQQSVNRSDAEHWLENGRGLWSTRLSSAMAGGGTRKDVGCVIFDHGQRWGGKRCLGLHELKDELDFWYDQKTDTVVVKCQKNPGAKFLSVELSRASTIVDMNDCHDNVYDGLCVRYGAAHGFGGAGVSDVTIRNCDICWIGGGIQYWDEDAKGKRRPVRYGNGIEFWARCKNILVERNRLWQIYDAALTSQSTGRCSEESITWRDNVVWQAEYSFEYWIHDLAGSAVNVRFEHNTCIDAGGGWGHAQRPDPNGAHLMFYDNAAATTNFIVRKNLFVGTSDRSVRMYNDWRMRNAAAHDGLEMMENQYWIPDGTIFEYHVHGRDRKANPTVKPMRFGAGVDEFGRYLRESGLDAGSIFAKPQFADPLKRDYRLKPEISGLGRDGCGDPVGARNVPGLDLDQSAADAGELEYKHSMMQTANKPQRRDQ